MVFLSGDSSEQTNIPNSSAPPSLSDQLSKQVRELNKKLLAIEQEKEQYQSDIQSIKQLLCQEMRIPYDEKMSISELKARFRGYRRKEEELSEVRFVEHNRNVSELFTTVRQNMKLYEKKISDAVTMIVNLGQDEKTISEESIARVEDVLSSLTLQKSKYVEMEAQLLNHDKNQNMTELIETNKKLRERVNVLESIQSAIRREGSSIRQEEAVDLCSLQQELTQKNKQIEQLQTQVSNLDAELAESERIREQQHQQLLLSRGSAESGVVSGMDALRLQLQRLREDQKQTGICMMELKNQNAGLTHQVQALEEELEVVRQRYQQCNEDYTKLKEKNDEIEKTASHIMELIEDNNRAHQEELEKVITSIKQETPGIVDQLKEYNYYYRQKEYNMHLTAYQRMEEFLMNRIRQLSNQINRGYAFVSESLDLQKPLEITPNIATKMTKAQICEMKQEIPVVNMSYLRELILKFISFPRGSSERTFLYPVMKALLSLGEREMRIMRGDMSYKPPSVIPLDKPLVKENKYIDSSTLLSQLQK